MTTPRWKIVRGVLTAIAVALFFGPIARDSNASHLTHPDWPGHARLHFMWAISFMAFSGLANLYYLWIRRPLDLAALRLCWTWQACSLLGGFWTAVALADSYGGTIRDAEHHATILGINENVLIFGVLAIALVGVGGFIRPRRGE
jgi:hypothetical protein